MSQRLPGTGATRSCSAALAVLSSSNHQQPTTDNPLRSWLQRRTKPSSPVTIGEPATNPRSQILGPPALATTAGDTPALDNNGVTPYAPRSTRTALLQAGFTTTLTLRSTTTGGLTLAVQRDSSRRVLCHRSQGLLSSRENRSSSLHMESPDLLQVPASVDVSLDLL
jgi:hypothetical protein